MCSLSSGTAVWFILLTIFAWVSSTPLGNPVVPLEYGSTNVCEDSTSSKLMFL